MRKGRRRAGGCKLSNEDSIKRQAPLANQPAKALQALWRAASRPTQLLNRNQLLPICCSSHKKSK